MLRSTTIQSSKLELVPIVLKNKGWVLSLEIILAQS